METRFVESRSSPVFVESSFGDAGGYGNSQEDVSSGSNPEESSIDVW